MRWLFDPLFLYFYLKNLVTDLYFFIHPIFSSNILAFSSTACRTRSPSLACNRCNPLPWWLHEVAFFSLCSHMVILPVDFCSKLAIKRKKKKKKNLLRMVYFISNPVSDFLSVYSSSLGLVHLHLQKIMKRLGIESPLQLEQYYQPRALYRRQNLCEVMM